MKFLSVGACWRSWYPTFLASLFVIASLIGCGTDTDCVDSYKDFVSERSLVIRIQNQTDEIQYIGLTFGSLERPGVVVSPAPGFGGPATCESLLDGRTSCGSDGQRAQTALLVSPGGERVETWRGTQLETVVPTPECDTGCGDSCPRIAPMPEGRYTLQVGYSARAECFESPCDCVTPEGSCLVPSDAFARAEFVWPSTSDVVIELK